jgi:DNA-binding IscR family transcriptional regulator
MKVANQLTRAGYLTAVRGRSGELELAKRPDKIRLGDVVRATEPDFALVECFAPDNQCRITPRCRLRRSERSFSSLYSNARSLHAGRPGFASGRFWNSTGGLRPWINTRIWR